MKLYNVANLIEDNGKTVRENNLLKKHAISVGTWIKHWPKGLEEPDNYEFAQVTAHMRDCDGTPLYVIEVRRTGVSEGWIEEVDLRK